MFCWWGGYGALSVEAGVITIVIAAAIAVVEGLFEVGLQLEAVLGALREVGVCAIALSFLALDGPLGPGGGIVCLAWRRIAQRAKNGRDIFFVLRSSRKVVGIVNSVVDDSKRVKEYARFQLLCYGIKKKKACVVL